MIDYLDVAIWFAGVEPNRWPYYNEIQAVAAKFELSIFKEQAYELGEDPRYYPPWNPATENVIPLRYLFNAAAALGHRILPYTSYFYANHVGHDYTPDQYLAEAARLKDLLGLTGIYVDGLTCPYNVNYPYDQDKNRYVSRGLRRIFGLNGLLVLHCTHLNYAAGTWLAPDPESERHFDLLLIGEDARLDDSGEDELREQYTEEQINPRVALGHKIALVNAAHMLIWPTVNAIGDPGWSTDHYTSGVTSYTNAVWAQRAP